MADPWRQLDDPSVSPLQVDAAARRQLGAVSADDPRRVAGLATWLVGRAALDGSTALPTPVLTAALRGYGATDLVPGVELAVEQDRLLALGDEQLVALPDVLRAEEAVAEEALRLEGAGLLSLVAGRGDGHRLSLPQLARLLERAGSEPMVVEGDPDALEPDSPGRGFNDLLGSGLLPVELQPQVADSPVGELLQEVRRGRLPAVSSQQRDVVLVPCADAGQVEQRIRQLVETSIPRMLGDAPVVLTVRAGGACGAASLRAALEGPEVLTVHEAAGRSFPAVVLVLPAEASGSLTRALVVSALRTVERHVSIVHQGGAASAQAVATRPHRPRLTRLPGLLREMTA